MLIGILTWKNDLLLQIKILLFVIFFLGGGFALAAGTKQSGLSRFLGTTLVALEVLPSILILIIICTATTFLTEVSSNTAVANIVVPVLAEMVTIII